MNLAQLIKSEMQRQRLSYDKVSERSFERGQGITPSYLCNLVNRPLNSVTHKIIAGVAAALDVSEDLVAAACWESVGYSVQRLPLVYQPASIVMGQCVVVSTMGLSNTQALEVQRVAEDAIKRMEASNGAGGHQSHSSASAPLSGHGLPHPREQSRHRDGSNVVPVRASKRHRTGTK